LNNDIRKHQRSWKYILVDSFYLSVPAVHQRPVGLQFVSCLNRYSGIWHTD
jgi:hypothetical protein